MRDCDLTFLSERFRLDWINSTSFLYCASSSQSGILSCDVSQEQLGLTGFGVKSLDPGCVLTVAGVTFVSAVAPRVGVQQVVTSFSGNFSFSDEIEALNRSLSKALEDFDQINYKALLRGGEELRHLQPLVPVTSHLWAVWLGIVGFPLLTLIGALRVWQFWARIFSFAVRGLAEGDRFHVGHEAELRRANEEEELWSQLVGEFSRLRREDEARTAAGVGSLASLVLRAAAENPEEGSADPE